MAVSLVLIFLALGALVAQSAAEATCIVKGVPTDRPLPPWTSVVSWISTILTIVALGMSAGRLSLAPDAPNFFGSAVMVAVVALVALGCGTASAARVVRDRKRDAAGRWLVLTAWASDLLVLASVWADLAMFMRP